MDWKKPDPKTEPRRPLTFNQRLIATGWTLAGIAFNLGSYLWNDLCFLGRHGSFACGTSGALAMIAMLISLVILMVVAWMAP